MTDFRYSDTNTLRVQTFYGTRWSDEDNKWVPNETQKNAGISPAWHGVSISDDVSREDLVRLAQDLYAAAEDREVYAQRLHRRLEKAVEGYAIVGKIARTAARAQDWCEEYEANVQKMCDQINDAECSRTLREAAERRAEYTVTVTVLARTQYAASDYAYRLTNNTEEYGCRVTGDPLTELKTPAREDEDENVEVSF